MFQLNLLRPFKKYLPLAGSLLLISCGVGQTNYIAPTTAQVVDGPVAGLTYSCVASTGQTQTGTTDASGNFLYSGGTCTFSVGAVTLGKITSLASDSKITPHDLAGVSRSSTSNAANVIGQFLQTAGNSSANATVVSGALSIPTTVATALSNVKIDLSTIVNDDLSSPTDTRLATISSYLGGSTKIPTLAAVQSGLTSNYAANGVSTSVGVASTVSTPNFIRIIAFNDVHGNLAPTDSSSTSVIGTAGSTTGTKVSTGGIAYMGALIKKLQSVNSNNIIVAAGDNIGASPYNSNIAHDEPTVDLLNQIGLSVSSVGNHEFDKGATELARIQGTNGTSTCYPTSGNFGVAGVDTCLMTGNTFTGANWTYLAANVTNSSGQTIFPATTTKSFTVNGSTFKVGFIGLTFVNTPLEVTPSGVAGLTFSDEATVINSAAATLKSNGANAVVVLIHQGGSTTSTVYGDTTCPGFNGEIIPIVNKLSDNVDLVVSGHTHTDYVCQVKVASGKTVTVTQSGFYTTGVTAIDLQLNTANTAVSKVVASNIPVINDTNTTAYPTGVVAQTPTPSLVTAVTNYAAISKKAGSVLVGKIASSINIQAPPTGCATAGTCDSGSRNKTVETPLGDLTADAMLSSMQGSSVASPGQIALNNAGGVRANLVTVSGTYPDSVNYSGLFTTTPFHNVLVAVDFTGPQILRILEQQWECPNGAPVASGSNVPVTCTVNGKSVTGPLFYAPGGTGEILMPSTGFTYTWDSRQPAGAQPGAGTRVVSGSIKLNGVALDMTGNTTYRVVTNTFLYTGGDAFTNFTVGKNPVQGGFDIDSLVSYLKPTLTGTVYSALPANRITKLDASGNACVTGTWSTCGNP